MRLIVHDRNQGMSEAYYTAFTDMRQRIIDGEISADDLIYTIDADGQHELAVLEELQRIMLHEGLDALLVQRDLSGYPLYKQLGNQVLSAWASLWAGGPLLDVESGYRIFRAGALANALDYYQGYKYSETVEVAVVLWRLGYKVRNDVVVPVPIYRSRTSMVDVVIDLVVDPGRRHPGAAPPAGGAAGAGARPGQADRRHRRARRRRRGRGRRRPRRPAPAAQQLDVTGLVEQLVEADRLQPPGLEAVEDQGQGGEDHRAVGVDGAVDAVVEQDDRARLGALQDVGRHLSAVVAAPVGGRHVPRHHGHVAPVDQPGHERGALSVGRPEEARAHPEGALEGVLGAGQLRVAGVEPAPVVVVVGVVAEELAVVVERLGDVGPGVEGLADGEERGLDPVGVEDVADLRG